MRIALAVFSGTMVMLYPKKKFSHNHNNTELNSPLPPFGEGGGYDHDFGWKHVFDKKGIQNNSISYLGYKGVRCRLP